MSKALIQAGWDDAPHLTPEQKRDLMASIPAYQRDARSKGIPQLGSGAIYPIPESEIVCKPIPLPAYWRRAYGFDVGWNRTAGIWGAKDPESKVIYLYAEHYRGKAEPSAHAAAVRAKGDWIPGAIDPAARGRGQKDGAQLLQDYRDLGLELVEAENGVEAGIFTVYNLLSNGQIKVFETLANWLMEYRLYRRDEKGNIVKKDDHLMDAMRYLVVMFDEIAKTKPSSVTRKRGKNTYR